MLSRELQFCRMHDDHQSCRNLHREMFEMYFVVEDGFCQVKGRWRGRARAGIFWQEVEGH